MELSLTFLRENPNKLRFIELSQNLCDWLSEPEKTYWKGKPKALSLSQKKILPVLGFISTNVEF